MAHWKRSLRLLGGCRLWCQGLLRDHGSSSGVAHCPRMRGLWLTWHPHGLLGHVWDRGLSRMWVMLRR